MEKLIVIHKNEGRVGTFLIAKGFQRKHEYLLRLINNHKERFESFSVLKTGKRKEGRGRPIEEYWLTEDQFIFLGTLLRNSEAILDFKQTLVKEFAKTRKQLLATRTNQQNQEWLTHRELGKKQRLELTDIICEFTEYAKSQGSQNADKYYMIISRMANSLLFIFQGNYQNTRNLLTPEQLITMASAEKIIGKGLRDGMKAKTFYKDIYARIRKNVFIFAELHGKSHVIEEQLKLEEK
jgi:phage regulator Rha-like protein